MAGVEQGFGPFCEPGKFRIGVFEFADADQAVGFGGDLGSGQLGEEAVAVDGPQQAVGVVVALVAKGGRLEGDHAGVRGGIGLPLQGEPKGAEFRGTHPHKLIVAQSFLWLALGRPWRCVSAYLVAAYLHPCGLRCPPCPRVHPDHAFDGRCAGGQPGGLAGVPFVEQAGEEAAKPPVAIVVAGDADIALGCAFAEVHAEYWADAVLWREPCEVWSAGGAVYVGEGHARYACRLRFGEQFLRMHDAIAEAEPRVGVQVHGP